MIYPCTFSLALRMACLFVRGVICTFRYLGVVNMFSCLIMRASLIDSSAGAAWCFEFLFIIVRVIGYKTVINKTV